VVHGFRNGGDAEVRYLNFHAPGQGFADYMRGLSDFDQHAPPADGGRPVSEVTITSGDGVLCEADEIAVAVLSDGEERALAEHVTSLYVLDGELAGTWLQIPPGEPYRVSGRRLEVRTPA
jgi:hypothetical protein